jgi:hypothetical protein
MREDEMEIGMLWFDNSNDPAAVKIRRAAQYYENKYLRKPNAAYVAPDFGQAEVEGIKVDTSKRVLKNHIWMGIESEA